jgi:hypothetical protein
MKSIQGDELCYWKRSIGKVILFLSAFQKLLVFISFKSSILQWMKKKLQAFLFSFGVLLYGKLAFYMIFDPETEGDVGLASSTPAVHRNCPVDFVGVKNMCSDVGF